MSDRVVDNGAPFLGRGWSFPPAFGAGGREVATVAGEEDIAQSLHIIFATELGERVMRDDFGCDLHRYVSRRRTIRCSRKSARRSQTQSSITSRVSSLTALMFPKALRPLA